MKKGQHTEPSPTPKTNPAGSIDKLKQNANVETRHHQNRTLEQTSVQIHAAQWEQQDLNVHNALQYRLQTPALMCIYSPGNPEHGDSLLMNTSSSANFSASFVCLCRVTKFAAQYYINWLLQKHFRWRTPSTVLALVLVRCHQDEKSAAFMTNEETATLKLRNKDKLLLIASISAIEDIEGIQLSVKETSANEAPKAESINLFSYVPLFPAIKYTVTLATQMYHYSDCAYWLYTGRECFAVFWDFRYL